MFQAPAAATWTAEETFVRRSRMPVSAETVFGWHARPGALERLIPPWSGIRVLERTGGVEAGAQTVLSMPLGPFRFRWTAKHVAYEQNRLFRDVQTRGPFAKWDHLHLMEPAGARLSDLEDRVTYALPLGYLGRSIVGRFVRRELERTFRFRHRTTCDDLAVHATRSRRALRIGVIAPDSFIGTALCPFLTTGGHEVVRIGASASNTRGAGPAGNEAVPVGGVDGLDALINLESAMLDVAASQELQFRKTAEKLERLQDLVRKLGVIRNPPRVFVNLSDTCIYGPRGYERLSDDAGSGVGASAEILRVWEGAAEEAGALGIRVVNARVGTVLTAAGGVLRSMLRAVRAGFMPVPGDGRQFLSWIGLDDVIGILLFVLTGEELDGAVNVVAPTAVTGTQLGSELLKVASHIERRPRLSSLAARGVFGRVLATRLESSTRAVPNAVLHAGYEFRDVTVESALGHTLGA